MAILTSLSPLTVQRPGRVGLVRGAGTRLASAACRRWFLDRDAEFWLRELGVRWSLTERRARVVEVIDETSDTRTLVLAPGRWWPGHRAGQYVPVELEVDGVRTRRCYSISSGSSAPGARRIAITVRRVAGGRGSTAIHALRRGAMVGLGEPAGDFVLEAEAPAKLLLVGGGSGITPIMAMIRELVARAQVAAGSAAGEARAPRDVVVIHGARSDGDAIFAAELASLTARFTWLRVLPRRDDDPATGRLAASQLRALVPDLAGREIFVCGPPGMMDVVTEAAREAGVTNRVHHERFVAAPGARLRTPAPGSGSAAESSAASAAVAVALDLVRSGARVVAAGTEPLLVQLERAGQRPAYGCRIGICNTCRCRKRSGTVEDVTTGAVSSQPDEDIRLCVSIARSDLALEL